MAEAAAVHVARRPAAGDGTPPAPWREALACLSFANICLLRVWREILTFSKEDAYFMKRLPSPADYLAAVAGVFLIAGILFAAVRLGRRLPRPLWRVARIGIMSCALIPLNSIRAVLAYSFDELKPGPLSAHPPLILALLALTISAGTVCLAWKWQWRMIRLGVGLLILASPFCVLTFGQALWRAGTYDPHVREEPALAPPLPANRAAPRILWVIFDEWDYRLTFVDRPGDLSLPAIDRFRQESIFATHATTPALSTGVVLPSLITGRGLRLIEATHIAFVPDPLNVSKRTPWQTLPTVFSAARRAGFNSALLGWYLPYCRLLSDSLTYCAWWPYALQANSTGDTFPRMVATQLESLFETRTLAPFGSPAAMRYAIANFQAHLASATAAAANPDFGLVFLHMPAPHEPYIYNRATGGYDSKRHGVKGYFDGLALADHILGRLREEMSKTEIWDRTAVLISADHPFRSSRQLDGKFDPRVPLLIKLPGQNTPAVYPGRFDVIITPGLVLSILRREVQSVADVTNWLDRYRNSQESPPL